jgi:putative transcriptional regulator
MGKKRNIGNELIQAMEEAVGYVRGQNKNSITHMIEVPDNVDVPKIRKKMALTPAQFASKYGFSYKTVQHWEKGDRRPTGPARILLAILAKEPNVVNKYLGCAIATSTLTKKEKRKKNRIDHNHKKTATR